MNEVAAPLADLLRSCIQCGLCLPHCATYLATGSEVQSPRGRLLLLGDVLASGTTQAPAAYLEAFDQCIGCRACETVCPSGVPFTLLAHGQELAARAGVGGEAGRPSLRLPGLVLRRLDSPAFLRLLGGLGAAARAVCRVVGRSDWRRRLDRGPQPVASLARLLGSLPASPQADGDLVELLDSLVRKAGHRPAVLESPMAAPTPHPGGRAVLFFRGCANEGLLPGTSRRLLGLMTAAGCAVTVPAGQECCGALAAHTGRPERQRQLERRNTDAFATAATEVSIVVEAAGCAHQLKSYPPDFASRVVDAASLLADLELPPLGPVPLRVACHDPCHARHGLHATAAPRRLLAAIPQLTWCEATQVEVCCGSGGAWGLRHPVMSVELARLKAADLAATGADLVVTTNPGCLGQIADGMALVAPTVPVLPLTDLLWYAACRRG
jgi:glycolate oxidase iron-sulfur subunit